MSSSKIVLPTKKEPKYILNGVTSNDIFGSLTEEILAFYADEDSIKKEIDAVYTAMKNGESTYELQYFAPVIMKGLSPRLAETRD